MGILPKYYLLGGSMEEIWEKLKLNYRVNRCLKTKKQKERESIYLSLVSLVISITVLIIKLFFK